uniref:Uncharacterized protein n=1 Tax=Timema douglasi TaxID=61478 RepID=A0A7R8VP00_TIMDO|nr:unnamed protein product [Timema douglasi]
MKNMALHDYRIVAYLDVIDDYFEEEANQVVVIQRRHKEVVWQNIFPMLEIDNRETRGLPMLHLQQILSTLQFYATEGLQEYIDLPVRNPQGEFRRSCASLH